MTNKNLLNCFLLFSSPVSNIRICFSSTMITYKKCQERMCFHKYKNLIKVNLERDKNNCRKKVEKLAQKKSLYIFELALKEQELFVKLLHIIV